MEQLEKRFYPREELAEIAGLTFTAITSLLK